MVQNAGVAVTLYLRRAHRLESRDTDRMSLPQLGDLIVKLPTSRLFPSLAADPTRSENEPS